MASAALEQDDFTSGGLSIDLVELGLTADGLKLLVANLA